MASSTLTTPKPGLERCRKARILALADRAAATARAAAATAAALASRTRRPWPCSATSSASGLASAASSWSSRRLRAPWSCGREWARIGNPSACRGCCGSALRCFWSAVSRLRRPNTALRAAAEADLKKWLGATSVLGAVFLGLPVGGLVESHRTWSLFGGQPEPFLLLCVHSRPRTALVRWPPRPGYVTARVWLGHIWITREAAVEAAALYWHFMDVLWVYLFVLLLVWR